MTAFRLILRNIVFLVALLAFPHKATAAGGTVVTVSGSTVTITVRINLCCLHDAVERNVLQPLVLAEIARAQAMWNKGLANFQGRGCYNIKVVFDVRFLNRASRDAPPPWDDGYHRLTVDFDQPGTPDVFDPEAGDANNDTTSAYRLQLDGTWYHSSMTPGIFAHEIGHLMGLGDDYYHRNSARRVDAGARPGTALPGRAGTLMDVGDAIDQNLADRLADLMTQAGLLPPCGWHGTFGWTHICVGGGNRDETRGVSDLTLDYDGRGNLTGTLAGSTPERAQTIPPCSFRYVAPGTFSAKLVGSYTPGQDTFSAQAVEVRTTPGRASWACPAGTTVTDQAFFAVYEGPMFRDAFRDLRRQPDGSRKSSGENTFSAGGSTCTTTYSLTLRQAQN